MKDLICNRAFVRLLWCYCFCNASSSVHFCRSNRHKCMEQKPNIHCYASSLIEAIGASVRNRSNRIERLTFPTVEAIGTSAWNRRINPLLCSFKRIEALRASARNRRSTRYKTSKQKRSTHHKRIKQKAVNKIPLWNCCLDVKEPTPFNMGWVLCRMLSKS